MGFAGKLNVETQKITLMSELSFPPFGYMMTIDSEQPDIRLVEITHFSRYDYNDFRFMQIQLPVLPTNTILPADYREKDQILADLIADAKFALQDGI